MAATKNTTKTRRTPGQEEKIRLKAYYHWLDQGRPADSALGDWLWAELNSKPPRPAKRKRAPALRVAKAAAA